MDIDRKYIAEYGPRNSSVEPNDEELARDLWETSLELVGVKDVLEGGETRDLVLKSIALKNKYR